MYGFETLEPILSGGIEGEGNISDLDYKYYNPSDVNGHNSGGLNEEPQNSDDIKAWDSANEHLFSGSRLTRIGATRSILLKLERKNGRPGDGRQAWLTLKSKYPNTYCSVGEHFCGV